MLLVGEQEEHLACKKYRTATTVLLSSSKNTATTAVCWHRREAPIAAYAAITAVFLTYFGSMVAACCPYLGTLVIFMPGFRNEG